MLSKISIEFVSHPLSHYCHFKSIKSQLILNVLLYWHRCIHYFNILMQIHKLTRACACVCVCVCGLCELMLQSHPQIFFSGLALVN